MTIDWTLIAMACAAIAGVVNLGAFITAQHHPRRNLRLWTALLAGFYVGSYLWLELGELDVGEWSTAIRPAGAVVFLSVWSIDPLLDWLEQRRNTLS